MSVEQKQKRRNERKKERIIINTPHIHACRFCAATKYALKYATSPFNNEHIDRLFLNSVNCVCVCFFRRFCTCFLLILFIFFVFSCSHFNALSSSTDWSIFGVFFPFEKSRIVFRYCGDSVKLFIFHVSACVHACVYERASHINFRSHPTIKQMSIHRIVTMCKSERKCDIIINCNTAIDGRFNIKGKLETKLKM